MKILNITSNKKKLLYMYNNLFSLNNERLINESKHYIPSTKEWYNSIYTFNKNSLKSIPVIDNYILRIIKNYFSFFSNKLEKRVKLPRLRRWMRRSSIIRILISKAELKHTNDKIIITLYIYNRQKVYYINKIYRLKRLIFGLNKPISKRFNKKFKYNILFSKKFALLKTKSDYLLKDISILSTNIRNKLKNKTILYMYIRNLFFNFIKKSLWREKLYLLHKRNLFINNNKFKSTYLIPLIEIIEKIYNKKIVFNIVSLKYPYLDSNIYLQLVMIKLRNRKKRMIKLLKKSMKKIRVPRINKLFTLSDIYLEKPIIQNISLYKLLNYTSKKSDILEKKKDKLSLSLNNYFNIIKMDPFNYTLKVLNHIRNKTFIGLRVEASGRLTKRITASRSLYILKHKGGIKNIFSSFKGLPSVISRGNSLSNLDLTKSYSKTRIGSYGIKGWINSI